MRTFRSPAKLFAFGIVGLILIVAAIDVMFGHWLSTAPEANDGVLSTRGNAQLRGDLLWGGAMVAAGFLLVGGAVVELVRRKPQAVVGSEGLTLAIGSHEHDVVIPWDAISDVSSEVAPDPFDGANRRYLLVDVLDRSGIPDDPLGATWEGTTLRVDADDWTNRVTDVALAAQGALAHKRRVADLTDIPPSVVWDIDVMEDPGEPSAEVKSSMVVVDEEPADAGTGDDPDGPAGNDPADESESDEEGDDA